MIIRIVKAVGRLIMVWSKDDIADNDFKRTERTGIMLYREYDSETLKKLQTLELEILRDFNDLCDKYDIDYFGCGGTAIGAVRHGGFIPWDDDIDVGLLRKDYDKFMKVAADRLSLPFEKKTLDTLKIARKHLKELPDKKLGTVCQHYGYWNEHAHRALDDAKATYHIYQKMKEAFFESNPESFEGEEGAVKVKKVEPMTAKQKNYLMDLMQFHGIKIETSLDKLSKREASKLIDSIILQYGKITRTSYR